MKAPRTTQQANTLQQISYEEKQERNKLYKKHKTRTFSSKKNIIKQLKVKSHIKDSKE